MTDGTCMFCGAVITEVQYPSGMTKHWVHPDGMAYMGDCRQGQTMITSTSVTKKLLIEKTRICHNDHCWHQSSTQHTVMNHECQYCCWCNEGRCVTLIPERMPGHGPYAPEVLRKPS